MAVASNASMRRRNDYVGMGRAVLWVQLVVLLCLTTLCSEVRGLSVGSVQACVDQRIAENNWKRKTDPQFHLFYGDAVVEIFNVLSKHDIKR
jgi:hypothetical protein